MHNRIRQWLQTLVERWRDLSLSRQYMLASAAVLVPGMLVIGGWVADTIEQGVSEFTATSTALYMDSFVAPLVQDLATGGTLSEPAQARLKNLMNNTSSGKRIVSFKIWKPGGVIAYSSHPETIGKRFPVTPHLERAWQGTITSEFDTLEDEEDILERGARHPLLEMYSPIREAGSGRIIAVGEFYETADRMKQELLQTRMKSWVLVAGVTLAMFVLLSGLVRKGSHTIAAQRGKLEERIVQLSDLRRRVARASMRTTEINERFLRRIGADLHDGPAQLLGLALLKLGTLRSMAHTGGTASPGEVDEISPIERALSDALQEIRDISAGLALPELEGLSLAEVLNKAIDSQERRTRIEVEREIEALPEQVGQPLNICFYRLIQESLNNAFLHAGASSARVTATYTDNAIDVLIENSGPGFDVGTVLPASTGLGLSGLRERIESLGGFFNLESSIEDGTRVSARFFVMDMES